MRAGNLPAFASQDAARQFTRAARRKVPTYADVDAGLVAQLGWAGCTRIELLLKGSCLRLMGQRC